MYYILLLYASEEWCLTL